MSSGTEYLEREIEDSENKNNNSSLSKNLQISNLQFIGAYITVLISLTGGMLVLLNLINLEDGIDGFVVNYFKNLNGWEKFIFSINFLLLYILIPVSFLLSFYKRTTKQISTNHLKYDKGLKYLLHILQGLEFTSNNINTAPVSNLIKWEHSHNYELQSKEVYSASYTLNWLNWVNRDSNRKRAVEIVTELILDEKHKYYFILISNEKEKSEIKNELCDNKNLINNTISVYKNSLLNAELEELEIEYLKNSFIKSEDEKLKYKFFDKCLNKCKTIKTILTKDEYEIIRKNNTRKAIIDKIINKTKLTESEFELLNINNRYSSIIIEQSEAILPLPNDFAVYKGFIHSGQPKNIVVINTGNEASYDIRFFDDTQVKRVCDWFSETWNNKSEITI